MPLEARITGSYRAVRFNFPVVVPGHVEIADVAALCARADGAHALQRRRRGLGGGSKQREQDEGETTHAMKQVRVLRHLQRAATFVHA